MNKPLIEATCEVACVEYHAETSSAQSCGGCVATGDFELCCGLAPCNPDGRYDRSRVIWVKA